MDKQTYSISFICLGNICRSPLAQGVFQDLVNRESLEERILISSAGVGNWHVGEPPDPRMQKTAEARGIPLRNRAQQIGPGDFRHLDLILAMDQSNLSALEQMCPRGMENKLKLFRSFDPKANGNLDVPDPYYGGGKGFELVFDIVSRTSPEILKFIRSKLGC